MEARICLAARLGAALSAFVLTLVLPSLAHGAGYRTKNFTVVAPTPQLAKEIGDSAEQWRVQLANEWLGETLADWPEPCPIKARVSPTLGAGGATSFVFDQGTVSRWNMNIQGSRERVLDSVLPHEITHTIFASHFRQPLPRWADEGACTTVEDRSEIAKQEHMLIDFLKTRRGIPFNDMFAMTEYPQDVLPLYAQGHSLSAYLIGQRGRREFMSFLADGMSSNDWAGAIKTHYGYDHLLALQNSWMDWVRAGRPALEPATTALASSGRPATPSSPNVSASVVAASVPTAHRGEPNAGWTSPPRPTAPTSAAIDSSVTPTPADDAAQPASWSAAATAGAPGTPTPASQNVADAAPARVSVYETPQNRGVMWR